MAHTLHRILTTHAGSLPRTPALVQLHSRRAAGEAIDPAALDRETLVAETRAVDGQLAAGLDVINDGEVGRESFFTYVRHRMSGFSGEWQRPMMRDVTLFPGFVEQWRRATASPDRVVNVMQPPEATGAVTYLDGDAVAADIHRLTTLLAPHRGRFVDAFMTAPSPGIVASAMANRYYPDIGQYIDAVAAALRTEYHAIADAGFILQIDAPDLALERHTLFADRPLEDFLDFVRVVVAAINRAVAGIPRERIRLHVCWGNYNGPHVCDVALPDVWPEIARANVGGYLISMANPRHEHEVALFRDGTLPADAMLVAGAIDVTSSYVEHPEVVALRIERAVAAVGDPARVMAGTDCGFETTAGYVSVAADVAWAKLRSLSEGAAIASRRLFG